VLPVLDVEPSLAIHFSTQYAPNCGAGLTTVLLTLVRQPKGVLANRRRPDRERDQAASSIPTMQILAGIQIPGRGRNRLANVAV